MFDFVNFGAAKLQIFLLILLRASGLFVISPVLSHRTVPNSAKVGLSILFAVIFTAALGDVTLQPTESLLELTGLAFRELLVGIAIGFGFHLLFWAIQGAGSLVGYQVGFAMANVLDPQTQTQQSIMSQAWFLIGMLIFLAINGHHLIIGSFADSYLVMPAGQVAISSSAGDILVKYTGYVFVLALKIAAPVMVTLFLTDVALGVVAKMMPTMNVFIVGFPLKIGVGLMVLALSLPIFGYVLKQATQYLDEQLDVLLLAMGKA